MTAIDDNDAQADKDASVQALPQLLSDEELAVCSGGQGLGGYGGPPGGLPG